MLKKIYSKWYYFLFNIQINFINLEWSLQKVFYFMVHLDVGKH